MIYLYQFLLYLIFPFIWLRLLWRSRRAKAYRQHWAERLGHPPFQLDRPSVWFHCASLGETIAATPMIEFILKNYPNTPVVLTTMTPTGRAKAQTLAQKNLYVCYVPYDYSFAIKRFFRHTKPGILFLMETELWPMLLNRCAKQGIPAYVLNARLSVRSQAGYAKIPFITRHILANISGMAAQTQDDKDRFIELGLAPNKITVTGSVKFDLKLPSDLKMRAAELRAKWGADRLVWIAASTHEGEEKIILNAFVELHRSYPESLLVIVPRHPERFERVAKACQETGLATVRRSQAEPDITTAIYVGDTLGELLFLYAASDIAFVGGSLLPPGGGHNPLEPAALSLPVIVGENTQNFMQIVDLMKSSGGLQQIAPEQLASTMATYFKDPALRQQVGEQALKVVIQNRGALQRQLDLMAQWMPSDVKT